MLLMPGPVFIRTVRTSNGTFIIAIAVIFNLCPGNRPARIRITYRLASRKTRLRQEGKLSTFELARKLGVGCDKIRRCRDLGLLTGYEYKEGGFLYDDPGPDVIERIPQLKRGAHLTTAHTTEEVQYAT